MRTIERSSAFKRDYKRVQANSHHRKNLDLLISDVLSYLSKDNVLPEKNRDHPLGGNWEGYRECHIKPDLLLIYEKPNRHTLQLVRLGSHSELFG